MNWLSLLGIFAKPLGAAVNNAIAGASGAAIVWAVNKGVDVGIATTIVSSLALIVSTAISGMAATQGVQIPVINKDVTNGVRVVAANSTSATVNAPL